MSINEQFMELAKTLPKKLQENAVALVKTMGEEIQGIGDDVLTWRPSYLKVVQGTSDRSKLPKGAAIGSLVIGNEILEQPLQVIPLRTWTSRQYWDPDHDANRQICYSPDAIEGLLGACRGCPYAKFDQDLKKSLCGMVKNFLVITADLSQIFYIQFAKTNFSNGRDWEKVMKDAGVNTYRRTYALETSTSTEYKNVEVLRAKQAGETPAELNDFLDAMMKQFGQDRKAHIDDFRESARARRENNNQNLALEDQSADKALEYVPEDGSAESDPSVDEGAKSYSL